MLVFPHWRSDINGDGCRIQRWIPAERFAPYFARPVPMPPLPPKVEDEDSSGGSSPERNTYEGGEDAPSFCGWRGCGARFPSVARLSAHVARTHAHAHSDGLFYCSWKGCARPQRGFNARYKMLVHVRTHTNERPHTCNQCQKSFSRAENLKIHLRSHSGEKPYVCPYEGCGKAYSNSSDRFKHTRTHAVEKPYCCKVPGCNKRYTDPSSLRKHVKTYKHYTTEQSPRRESSEETQSSDSLSPSKEVSYYPVTDPSSPLRVPVAYSPPRHTASPLMPYPVIQETPVYPMTEQITYIRPRVLVPSDEMSYVEYTQMYEHAYRNYYSNINYNVRMHPAPEEMNTLHLRIEDAPMKLVEQTDMYSPIDEKPLNLICNKRLACKPIEDLIIRTDSPLDLSTKS